ncbi:response regulator [Nonomuraea fuscirosea]|uniref:response regulator n=2 Tax=Nonomuraea fuscirosea TaxID=1291556 RepID=UPI00343E0D91
MDARGEILQLKDTMDVRPERLPLSKLLDYVDATFRPLTVDRGLKLEIGRPGGGRARGRAGVGGGADAGDPHHPGRVAGRRRRRPVALHAHPAEGQPGRRDLRGPAGAHRGRRHPQRLRPTHVLGRLGMEIVYAENGREGLEALEREKDIALVPMDVMMPEMDGYETLTAVRQTPAFAGLPIIALTAKAMPGDREKTIACGASDYVPKPVDVDRLLEVMRGRLAGERETGG